jgi:hypothetical protein
MLESLGKSLGLDVEAEDEDLGVVVSLQDIRPTSRISPHKYFMPKKYIFFVYCANSVTHLSTEHCC